MSSTSHDAPRTAPELLHKVPSYLADNRYAEAVAACEGALAAQPGCTDALLMLGLVSFEMEQPTQALTFLNQAHNREPAVREYADALATVHTRLGNINDGLFYAKLATTLMPNPALQALIPQRYADFFASVEHAQPYRFRARAEFLLACDYIAEAASACEKQLEITPEDAQTKRLLARAARLSGETTRAISLRHKLLHGDAPENEDHLELARALSAAGLFEEAAASYDYLLNRCGNDPSIASERLDNSARNPGIAESVIQAEHTAWVSRHALPLRWSKPPSNVADPDRPLRIAYLANSFGTTGISDLIAPVIASHNANEYPAYCYAEGAGADPRNESVRRHVTKWTDLGGIDHETAAEILRGDRIDIAVDLTGHGAGSRLLTLARRPVPVAVSWLTTPLPADGITDHQLLVDRAGAGKDQGTRSLPILAPFRPPATAPDVKPPPVSRLGHITFGARHDLTAIGPGTAAVWAPLLQTVANSRLLIANATGKDQDCVDRCAAIFSHFGVRDRVDVINLSENFLDPLEFYDFVDIALDSYPVGNLPELYNALWMGAPVLSLAGRGLGGRVGLATLNEFGAAEWAAGGVPAFLVMAAALSADVSALERLRETQRERLRASTLTDTTRFARELERIYRSVWSDWCRQT